MSFARLHGEFVRRHTDWWIGEREQGKEVQQWE